MGKVDHYREKLQHLENWEPFLLEESNLPGRRANIELARAVAEEAEADFFDYLLTFTADKAPVNSPHEFLAFCGVLGLGRLLANGDRTVLDRLRLSAGDPRWRIREAVAMALQRFGAADLEALLDELERWMGGSYYEQRAAAAGLCEPQLLAQAPEATRVLAILNHITAAVVEADDRQSGGFQVLKKGLGYCWSVAVEAFPEEGKAAMEGWFEIEDPDLRWVMKENLRKKRLRRIDPGWVDRWRHELEM